ncbi:uncharacterized protein LOC143295885 [Babylonia areolata]|uniref:uncharacterized protein LOC143295885 n=1 Tax=Babylonia areolata TaxID=304850 RepID=UPI003FD655E4
MSEENDCAMYQERLVEIFQSCDSAGKGFLSLLEFERLCRQLHLQPHKERLYRELGLTRSSVGAKVYFEDFKSVLLSLLQEVGPDKLTSDQPPNSNPSETAGQLGDSGNTKLHSKGGEQSRNSPADNSDLRLHLPPDMLQDDEDVLDASGDDQDGTGRVSPPSHLKRAYTEDPNEDGQGSKHQRRSWSPAAVETFEADGLLTASPIPGDAGLDSDSGLEQLQHVCSRLGVGCHGYLSQQELEQVCQFIGMEQMDQEELEILFNKLDADHDGYISFAEFVDGLAQHTITPRGFDTSTPSPALRPHSARKARTPLPLVHQDRRSPAVHVSGESISLFSSLQNSESSGVVTGEEVVDFWEQLSVAHAADLLTSLGFDPQSRVSLKDLSSALSREWYAQAAEGTSLAQAATATCLQEILCLRSWLDQTREEREKLRSHLADTLSRNSIMAAEVDERHAQLEKSHEERLKAQETEHQEQVRQLQSRLEQEQEAQSSQSAVLRQTSEQLHDLHQQVSLLQDRLEHTDAELTQSQQEVSVAQDRAREWEALYRQVQKELQQQQRQAEQESPRAVSLEREKQAAEEKAVLYAVQNKELKDHNDELLSRLEDLQQQTGCGTGDPPRSANPSHIPVRTRASSASSDTSEWDDDDMMSSTEALFDRQHGLSPADQSEKAGPSLSAELKQQQKQKRGERRERELKEIEHGFRVEIAELEDRYEEEKQQLVHSLEREKVRLREEHQSRVSQELAEQQRELQNAFALEKQDLLQQYESRLNLQHLQHQQQLQALQHSVDSTAPKADPIQDIAVNLQTRSRVQELERAKAELELEQEELKAGHQAELEGLQDRHEEDLTQLKADHQAELEALQDRHEEDLTQLKADHQAELEGLQDRLEEDLTQLKADHQAELEALQDRHEEDLTQLKASTDHTVQAALVRMMEEGVDSLEGKLKEDFLELVQQQIHKETSALDNIDNKEELCAAFEQDKLSLVQHYESQIQMLREELGALRQDFEAERAAFQQLQSGSLAQSIRHELQEEMGDEVDEVSQSWEKERRELVVQNQLLEEELADLKGQLVQERQRSAEAHSLREAIRRLRSENKEVQVVAEGLKEKVGRLHQQKDLEKASYERRLDELQRDKDQALRLQALQYAGTKPHPQEEEENALQKEVLQQMMEEVEAMRSHSPLDPIFQEESLDQLQGQITQLHHQMQEARTAQLEFQQLKDECEVLRQTNTNLEEMVRVLRQRSNKEQAEREREEQEQIQELSEEKKKLQNLLQRTTDKLLQTSTEMAAGQTQLVRKVEELKQQAGNMVELETFTGLQVSLLETQRHAIALQEALMQRTQLADRIVAETEKQRRQERDAWEIQKAEMLSQHEATTEMYRSLAAKHKALRLSTTRLAAQLKELYAENADLMMVLQQTEAKHMAAQRRSRKLQQECQAMHDAVHHMLHRKGGTGR